MLPLAVNKEYLPSAKYMLRNINIYPDVPTDASVSNWPFELIYASDVQHLKGYVLQLHGGGVVRVQGQRVRQQGIMPCPLRSMPPCGGRTP